MREYVINRPAPDAMGRILDQAGPEGIVLRLAWQAGLSGMKSPLLPGIRSPF